MKGNASGNSNPIQAYEVEDVNTGFRKPMQTLTCEKNQKKKETDVKENFYKQRQSAMEAIV